MLVKNNIPNSSFIFFNSIDTLFITQNEKRFDLLIVDTRSESDLDLIYSKSSFLKKEIKIVCLMENLNFNKRSYTLMKIIQFLETFFSIFFDHFLIF